MLPGQRRLPYVLARFCDALFAPDLFELHGIAAPEAIRASVGRRQAEFLAGRICAQKTLAAHGRAAHMVGIGRHREPLWPPGHTGSITHTRDYAAAVACQDAGLLGIGIDIETIADADACPSIAALAVSPAEMARLYAGGAQLGEARLLTLAFSVKESFFKAAFREVGEYFDFDAVEVWGLDLKQGTVRLRCTRTLGARLQVGQMCEASFEFLDDAILTALVLDSPCPETAWRDVAVNYESDFAQVYPV